MASARNALIVCAILSAASPLAAQSPTNTQPRIVNVPGQGNVYVQPVPADDTRSVPRTVNVPGYGNVYVVPVRPKDTRSPRQRGIDEEVARKAVRLRRSQWVRST